MEEKIKVNITPTTYGILLKDIELFEFYKPNGGLNKNLFLTTLIVNYYQDYYDSHMQIVDYLTDQISPLSGADVSDLATRIADHLNRFRSNPNNDNYSVALAIKPTRQSREAFDYIEKYFLTNTTMSNYFRSLFESYALLPQDHRERIIFRDQYLTISRAIKEKRKLFIQSGIAHEVIPYSLVSTKEELFNYLLALDGKAPATFRLTRIKSARVLVAPGQIDEAFIPLLERIADQGPQYAFTRDQGEIHVILSGRGRKLFKSIYLHRPRPTRIEGDNYYFNCSISQAFQYFSRFGEGALVVSPPNLVDQLIYFYRKSLRAYTNKTLLKSLPGQGE